MESIIDRIAAAEAEAEEIRQEAITKAREETLSQKAQADKTLDELERCERENMRTAAFEAEQRGEMLSGKILAEMAGTAENDCAKAEAKLSKAQDYLMEKVLDFA